MQQHTMRRELGARQISFMALGMAIGVGLFLGSASAIKAAGPGALVAYLIGGAMIFLIMRALGEMAVHRPVSDRSARMRSNTSGRSPATWSAGATGC